MRVFSVFAPDSRSLIFTKFIDIRVLSCWKACKNEVKGGCALRPAMFCKCLCGLLRAVLSGFYPLGTKEAMQAVYFCMEAHGRLTGQLSEIRTVVCVCGKTQ